MAPSRHCHCIINIASASRGESRSPTALCRGKAHPGKTDGKTVAYHRAGDVTRPRVGHYNCVGVLLASNGRSLSISYRDLEVGWCRPSSAAYSYVVQEEV